VEFQLEQWHWWVLTLAFVVCAAMFVKMIYIWLTIATVIVGAFAWIDPNTPLHIQLMLFGVITMGGVAITQYFGGKQQDETQSDNPEFANQEQAEQQQNKLVGRIFTLEEPIINGSGTLKFDDQVWRLRGKDAAAGSEICIISIDGIDSSLLQVSLVKSTTNK